MVNHIIEQLGDHFHLFLWMQSACELKEAESVEVDTK